MNTYVMLTRLSPDALAARGPCGEPEPPSQRPHQARVFRDQVTRQLGGRGTLRLGGHFSRRLTRDTATKVAFLVRSLGRTAAQLWTATPWDVFVDLARHLKS
jgi:hypothetical protein